MGGIMANDLNRCSFIGRLGRDPEVKYMPSGSAVVNFSIAVGQSWKDKETGQKKEKTEWVRISAFGKLAEICGEYLSKGKQIFISGRMETRKWEKDGVPQYSTEIIANDVQFLGSRVDSQETSSPVVAGAGDDIPF